jgi:uncharacterized protein (DUF1778 family)
MVALRRRRRLLGRRQVGKTTLAHAIAGATLNSPARPLLHLAAPDRHTYMTSMALSAAKRTTTLILDAETDRLLDVAARDRGLSRSEFIRAQLRRVLEQYKSHPKPRSAGAMTRARAPRDEEADVFRDLER